jgi:hypothetical protein
LIATVRVEARVHGLVDDTHGPLAQHLHQPVAAQKSVCVAEFIGGAAVFQRFEAQLRGGARAAQRLGKVDQRQAGR